MKTMETPLKERWSEYRRQNPKTRIRDAARALGVSEAQLLATGAGANVTRLESDWTGLIQFLPKLGRVMCLTRNEAAVHERFGEFRQVDFFHGMGQVVGPDIDLRLILKHWRHGFAVTDHTKDGDRQSLQFFDGYGDAVHKVFLQGESDYGSYGVLLDRFRAASHNDDLAIEPAGEAPPCLPDVEIDIEGFHRAWLGLKDTHGFFPLLGKFRVGREQALRLAPTGHAVPVPVSSVRRMLETAAETCLPIMVFIGSRGCIQIHTGCVQTIKMFGDGWLNVLDPDFNMHLRLPLVARAWIVRKPTTDGIVTSLEIFDDAGDNVALFFGKRKPGAPEEERWRSLCGALEAGA
jgi:putative hemin transport protein